MDISEILAALKVEIGHVEADLGLWLETLSANPDAAAEEFYQSQLVRSAETCAMLELHGLAHWFELLTLSLAMVAEAAPAQRLQWAEAHAEWPGKLIHYLDAPDNSDCLVELLQYIADERLLLELEGDALIALQDLLFQPIALPDAFNGPAAEQEIAQLQDTSLNVPSDVDPSVYEAFMGDSADQAARLSALVMQAIAEQDGKGAALTEARRIAHSFKGVAAMIGIRGISKLSHRLEDILDFMAALPAATPLPQTLVDTLQDATGTLEQQVYALMGEEEAPKQALAVLQAVMDWDFVLKTQGLEGAVPAQREMSSMSGMSGISPEADNPALTLTSPDAIPASAAVNSPQQEEEASTRVPVSRIDEFLRTAGELFMGVAQLRQALGEAQQRQKALLAQNFAMQARLAELDRAVSVRGISVSANKDASALDALELDQYNELYGLTKALYESSADFNDMATAVEWQLGDLSAQAARQETIARNFQRLMLNTRMQTVSSLSARLKRTIRQTCRSTGKQAELTVIGEEVLLDREVLEQLAEPLLHILRNAVDHGIELPDDRLQAGKTPSGSIEVRFSEQAGAIEVLVKDDGAGLNFAAIEKKALALGLLSPGQPTTEDALARLIMQSGFTTRTAISEVSGRGVGMDVVRERLERMRGSVQIRSATGQGSQMTLRFPASRALFFVLLVRVANQLLALPASTIVTALAPGMGLIEPTDNNAWQIRYNDQCLPLRTFAEVMGLPSETLTQAALHNLPIVLIRGLEGDQAVAVDALVASREVLLQPLHPAMANLPGLLGATILPDRSVAPVIDVVQLLRDPAAVQRNTPALSQPVDTRPVILVVDDSLSVRRSLTQLLGDSGYRTQTAIDGLDAVRQLGLFKPALILTDLEMPNMNGLEFTRHVRNRTDLHNVPVVMISSRSMDKHRKMAQEAGVSAYVTKPYIDDKLLDQLGGLLTAAAAISTSTSTTTTEIAAAQV